MLWLRFKLQSSLFGNTRDKSVMHEKAKFACFNYMQPQEMKFKSVQINMKHVSCNIGLNYQYEIHCPENCVFRGV